MRKPKRSSPEADVRSLVGSIEQREQAFALCDQEGFKKYTRQAIAESKRLLVFLRETAATAAQCGDLTILAEAREKIVEVAGAMAGFELDLKTVAR